MAFASIDIMNGIVRGRTTESLGYNAMRDRRPETYTTTITAPRVPRVQQ